VRYLRSTYRPDDGSCHCLFDADSIEAVRQAKELAAIPHDRIVPAMHLAASALPTS
jgi:hypothetical protein